MANEAIGQPPTGVAQVPNTTIQPGLPLPLSDSYISKIKPNPSPFLMPPLPPPTVDYHHGEPQFVWIDKDVDNMVIHEELQFAVVGKFAYGMPDFHDLRKQIPLQCEIKGECSIGFLESRHVLIRLSMLEDYVHLLSKPAFYVKIGHSFHQMRGLKYDIWFDPREETPIAMAWISFPGLPPVFFVKDAVFALATAVGKPLQLDAATKAKSRPSCAKVKVEVDLLATHPQRVRIGIKSSTTGETRFKWVRIRYDYIPKYCRECRLQGHNEEECYVLHPEDKDNNEVMEVASLKVEPPKVLQSGKIVGNFNKGDARLMPQQVDRSQSTQKKNDNLDAAQPVLVQGNQRRNDRSFLHPNRNQTAWSRVDTKKKQRKEDAQQIETVPVKNSFAMLEREEADKILVATDVTNAELHVQKPVVFPRDKECSTPSPTKPRTRDWALSRFKDHPLVKEVGVTVVSGTRATLKANGNGSKAKGVDDEAGKLVTSGSVETQDESRERNCGADTSKVADLKGIKAGSEAGHVASPTSGFKQLNDVTATGIGPALLEVGIAEKTDNAVQVEISPSCDITCAHAKKLHEAAAQNAADEHNEAAESETASHGHEGNGAGSSLQSITLSCMLKDSHAQNGEKNKEIRNMASHMGTLSKECWTPTLIKKWTAIDINCLLNDKGEGDVHKLEDQLKQNRILVPINVDDGKCMENKACMELESESEVITPLNFGKPYLNINAPSFLPKSILQIAPHSKRLPSDNELINQMDWHDTKGILARQVMFIHDEPRQTNYLVEDEDIFEDEEFDEESTAYNFSIVAREGDLSPRPIRDKAIKKVMKERRPLEPTRVQPSRSTKSKKYKDWKNSKK